MTAKAKTKKVEAEPKEPVKAPEPPTVALQTVKNPFTATGNKILASGRLVLVHVGKITILNTTVRQKLSPVEAEILDDILYELRVGERELVRVENFADFMDPEKQLNELLSKSADHIREQVVKFGMDLTDEEITSLTALAAAKKKVKKFFDAIGGLYVPMGKRASEPPLNISNTEVSNGSYTITVKQAQNVWKRAYAEWGEGKKDPGTGTLTHSWDKKRINIYNDRIQIGCQRITRWQAEDLAVRMGWVTL